MKYKALFAALTMSVLLGLGANAMSGSGTKDDPYLLAGSDDFIAFAASVNDGTCDADTYAALDADIDFTDTAYTVIGTAEHPYTGHFDGHGYTVSGVTIDSVGKEQYSAGQSVYAIGLFGFAENAQIENLYVKNCTVKITDCAETVRAGLLCGDYVAADASADNGIRYCGVDGVMDIGTKKTTYTGGIVGCITMEEIGSDVTVSNCSTAADITVRARYTAYIGGIAGKASEYAYLSTMTIECCTADIECETHGVNGLLTHEYIGGIVGSLLIDNEWQKNTKDASLSEERHELDRCTVLAFATSTDVTPTDICHGDIVGYYKDPLTTNCISLAGYEKTSSYSICGAVPTAKQRNDAAFWTNNGYDLDKVWMLTGGGIVMRGMHEQPTEEQFKTESKDGTWLVTADPTDIPLGTLWMAVYATDGRLTDITTAAVVMDRTPLIMTTKADEAAFMRFFVFADDSFAPLAECVEITAE